MSNKKKILITGAAGFIGFHLVRRLLASGIYEVLGLDNINAYYDVRVKYARLKECGIREAAISPGRFVDSTLWKDYRFVQMDVTDRDKLAALAGSYRPEAIVHLAAQAGVRHSLTHPHLYTHNNVTGFLEVLELARHWGVKHLVFASTSGVYGLNGEVPYKETDPTDQPASLYAATKKANELMAYSYSHLYELPATAVRFFTVYGPWGRPDMALFLFAQAMLEGKAIHLFNNGDMVRDFTYIDDLVEGLVRILEQPAAGPAIGDAGVPFRVVNIGNAQPVPLIEYVAALEEALGQKAERVLLPMQPGDVQATHADVSRLRDYYGYTPVFSIKEGVRNFVNWYRDFYAV